MKDEMLFGSYIRSIDSKKRVILPSEYDSSNEDIIIFCDKYYIRICSIESIKDGKIDGRLAATGDILSVDAYKRLSITDKYIKAFKFNKSVALIGRYSYIDLVPIEMLDKYEEENKFEEVYKNDKDLILKLK